MNKNAIQAKAYRLLGGFLCILLGLFILLALVTYHPEGSRFYSLGSLNGSSKNYFGSFGAGFCFYACRYLGTMAWMLPLFILWLGVSLFKAKPYYVCIGHAIAFLLLLLFGSSLLNLLQVMGWIRPNYAFYSFGRGGILGASFLQGFLKDYLGTVGCMLILTPTSFLCLFLTFSHIEQMERVVIACYQWLYGIISQKCNFVAFSRVIGCCKSIGFKLNAGFHRIIAKIRKTKPVPMRQGSELFPYKESAEPFVQSRESIFLSTGSDEEPLEIKSAVKDTVVPEPVVKKPIESVASQTHPVKEAPVKTTQMEMNMEGISILPSESVELASNELPSRAGDYKLPSLDLLKDPPPVLQDGNAEDYYETANNLVQKLAEFGVSVKVENIQAGPVITRYEVTPARGVRVEKIATLDKNIALALKALSVRIQAPVPGKGCVGIEVPNRNPLPVCLREILASRAWEQSDAEIPIVLGKEVTGKPIVADLTKMPHLLIAGATGSGKTVCINAIIASLLFRETPKNLRFIMVDPKIVEMKIYNDLPHMLIPVVTDPKRVPGALKWLISEMERRYKLFANYGARNITTFNEKLRALSESELAEKNLEHLPYIVCIIDELADLMMVAPGDIETCIARLAQLARAAGIHLVIATQRPSVNVITGIIKANLPSRIAFKVASKVDSRTILDLGGADNLIGRGDMLFVPPGASQLIRAQGAWVSDDEINNLVEFLSCNGKPNFSEDIQQIIEDESNEGSSEDVVGDDDSLLPQALEILKSSDRISTSLLQRRLKIGYNRAARIMDVLTERGLVPRNVE